LQDGVHFEAYQDARTQRPVYSFYGDTRTFPEPFLREVDMVVFHAQDVSHRAYTYHWALADTLAAAARTRTRVLVLDRPSPLAHLGSHGPLFPQFFPLGLPVVLAATLGELARWLRDRLHLGVDLHVLPVRNWRRTDRWPHTGLPWVPPSPNIPSLDSAYAYACTGILQQTNVAEGRGTCKPFEYFGAPFVNARELVAVLTRRRLPGVTFREVCFQPAFNKYAGEVCAGCHLMITEPGQIDVLCVMFGILQELARSHPRRFRLLPGFGAWLDGQAWSVEKLSELDADAYLTQAAVQTREFVTSISPFLLYP
jgi:uncharacterized protein YbbC (DUF1343 family)